MPPSTGNASFLQNHHGHIRSQQAREHSTRLWKDITAHVNSMGGAVKTVEQWKKPMEQAPKVLAIMGEGFGNAQMSAVINPFAVMEPYRHSRQGVFNAIHPSQPATPSISTDTPVSRRERRGRCQRPARPAADPTQALRTPARTTLRRSLCAQNNYGQRVIQQEEQKLAQL